MSLRLPSGALENGGEEARVVVNQRALIDKVLARYPGEFTLFRELLQNSDDAGSSAVQICFETAAYRERSKKEDAVSSPSVLPDLKSTPVAQWTYRNNGKPFEAKDWERLPRIADGNPNPMKVGAFGVGFYSLFFVTESPRVSSGGFGMQFYWKNNDDQLYVRRGNLPANETLDPWTTFEMPLREPCAMPATLDLMRFLASSIIFMENLREISVFFDDHHIGHMKKSLGPSQPINVPVHMERSTPGRNMMHVEDIQCHRVSVEADVMNVVYRYSGMKDQSSVGPQEKEHFRDVSRVDLTVYTANVAVTVDEQISKELTRCLKKMPPSRLKYSLIYTGKEEYDQSSAEQRGTSIFRGLRADLEWAKHTRIFIGHATGQTTGIGGHMASHFIPTVERESIDLVNSGVSIWNRELLYVGGFLCRAVYETELSHIENLWEETATDAPDSIPLLKSQEPLHQRFLHVLKFFTFHHSTPSPKVAQILRDSFYQCSTSPVRLLSSIGVRASTTIRAFDPDVTRFLKCLPMLSEIVHSEALCSIEALPSPHKISPITIKDVLQNLSDHPLSEEELVVCLRWWMGLKRQDSNSSAVDLFNVVSLNRAGGVAHSLTSIKFFIDQKGLGAHIPLDGPLPTSLIPLNISTHFTRSELVNLGWQDFTIINWFQHISSTDVMFADPAYDFTKSASWAERVLCTLSLGWTSLPDQMRRKVKNKFAANSCIPTSQGLCLPDCSYLPITKDPLFGSLDLPVVTLTSGFKYGGGIGIMLSFLGVRTRIPLELLSTRILDKEDWDVSDVINYLVRLSSTLNPQDISTLKSLRLFLKEAPQNNAESDTSRYCAEELYPPVEVFRQLQLPVIDWHQKPKWSNDSDEAKLLYRLGLRPCPPLELIINLCSSPEKSIGETAFSYLCDNLRLNYPEYNPNNFRDCEFIPAENKEGTCLKKLDDVFLGIQWKALGFSVVQGAYRSEMITELGIKQHPSSSTLLHFLETTRPPNQEIARQWYECLLECVQHFAQPALTRLSGLSIVPTDSSGSLEWLSPSQCYLGPSTDEFHSKLFVFVDFGSTGNRFLSTCGSRKEPSVKDVAESLVNDPDRFYKVAGGPEGFLERLRDLAVRKTSIPNDILRRMSSQRTLLGERRVKTDDQFGWKVVYELRTPREIVIVDDSRDYSLFSDAIFVAPQDELLERFYGSLGCRRLSTVIQERYDQCVEISDPKTCTEVRALVLQRLPFFLRKCPHAQYDKRRVPSLDNFSVTVCEKLTVYKTLIIGDDSASRTQHPFATIQYSKEEGKVELWLSRHAKRDLYDISTSLCRLLFGTVKVNDALLLGTMLSDLDILKQAGLESINVNHNSEPPPSEPRWDAKAQGSATTQVDPSTSSSPIVTQGPLPQSAFAYIRHTITDSLNSAYYVAKGRLISSSRHSNVSVNAIFLPENSWARYQVIPQSYIGDVVNMATEASGGSRLFEGQDRVTQFLKHQSCNDFEKIRSLRSLGSRENIEIHVAEDIPNIDAFLTDKQEVLARFIRILGPAASAHKLSTGSLHIFYEIGEGPIAFNREGSLYLNLRYYEAWHDENVKNGVLQQAQLSWFFALAHEIAHNLIQTHDSAHEFWFAAICEAHIGDFFTASTTVAGASP